MSQVPPRLFNFFHVHATKDASTKPKRRTVPRVASDVMTSCRARRMSERRLESEDIDPSLYRVRRMAVPQLVWVNVEPGGSSPHEADLLNGSAV